MEAIQTEDSDKHVWVAHVGRLPLLFSDLLAYGILLRAQCTKDSVLVLFLPDCSYFNLITLKKIPLYF